MSINNLENCSVFEDYWKGLMRLSQNSVDFFLNSENVIFIKDKKVTYREPITDTINDILLCLQKKPSPTVM